MKRARTLLYLVAWVWGKLERETCPDEAAEKAVLIADESDSTCKLHSTRVPNLYQFHSFLRAATHLAL